MPSFVGVSIMNGERWVVRTDFPSPILFDEDGVILTSGASAQGGGGALHGAFAESEFDGFGGALTRSLLSLNQDFFYGVYKGAQPILLPGDISAAPQLPMGSQYSEINRIRNTGSSGRGLLVHALMSTALGQHLALVELELDAAGAVVSEAVVTQVGDLLPGANGVQSPVLFLFNYSFTNLSWGGTGKAMYTARLDNGDVGLYLGNTLLACVGCPSVVPGETWTGFFSIGMDVNSSGSYAFLAPISGDSSRNSVLVRDGAAFLRKGDSLPAIAPFQVANFGQGHPDLADTGEMLWYARWNDPDTDRDTGLFLDDQLLVQEGVTQVAGSVVDTIWTGEEAYSISDDGLSVAFIASLEDGRIGVFLVDLGLGGSYCDDATTSSLGQTASLQARGSSSLASNDLSLVASPVPAQPGLFFFGTSATQVPLGDGFRCVGGNLQRLSVAFSTDGYVEQAVDLAALGFVPSTVYAQYWYRDPAAAGAGFNLSTALELVLVP